MAAIDCSLTIYAHCPYCDSGDTRVACATSIVHHRNLLFVSGMSETEFPDDLEFTTGEALLKGWCLHCLKTFSIFLTSSTINEEGLDELTEPVSVGVDFSVVGRPTGLIIEQKIYPIRRVHSHKLLSSFFYDDAEEKNVGEAMVPYDPTLESLFGRAPFGTWDIEIDMSGLKQTGVLVENLLEQIQNRSRCVLDISSNHLLGMLDPSYVDKLSARITHGDVRMKAILVNASKMTGGQAIPGVFLAAAAFSVVADVERKLRERVWQILKTEYDQGGKNWWKGILDSKTIASVERRAVTAGYLLGEHSPEEFLSLGEVRDIVLGKWDAVFSRYFGQQQKLLGDLATFEEYRNNVAHVRPLSLHTYTNCVRAAKDLRRRFGL
jgi:hypothetical protein